MTLSDNSAYEGGGLYVDYGTLNATLTTVSGNTAEYGGGIYSEWGTVTFADGTVNGNTARSGGGIYNDFGTVGLADSTIGPDNLATNGGGGGLYSYGGSLELSNTGVDGNDAYGDGGGVYLSGGWPSYDGTMTMLGGSVSNNEAFEYECEGPCPALGGGLANYFGFAQLTQVAVTGNTVNGYGGGVSNGYNATTVISESDVSGNTVFTADSYDPGGSGGGVFSYGTLTVDSTTISGNLADFNGGGIAACDSDAVAIFNTTVSGNTAPTGGGISIDGCFYDYLPPESSDTRLNNVTVTDNTAFDSAGGIENLSAPLTLSNTIVAGNEIDNDGFFPDDCVSGIPATDGGYNLIGAGGCSLTDGINGNQVGAVATPIDPGLATLADNGGPTLTYALEAGSPAIDVGDPGNSIEPIPSTCESVDQRGVSRPQGEACDIGAFEFDEVIIPPSVGDVFLNVYTETEGSDSEPGVVEVPIVDIPIERVTGSDDILGSAPLSSIPLSSIPLSSIDLGASPLSSIPLSSIPLSSIPLSSIPLSSIPLSSIPLSSIGGWGAILDGTIYEDEPTQNVTLKQLLALNLPGLADVNIGQLSIAGSPLSSISLPSLSLGSATLSELRTGLEPDLCTYVPGYTCNEATTTLLGLEIQGAPLSSIPLSSIPLSSIDLGATPLSSIPLSSIPLSSIPLSSIPLSSIELGTAPLSSIPLSSIDLLAAPLSSIPLSSIPLSSIPLSSIQIGDQSFCDWLAAESTDGTTCAGLGLNEDSNDLADLLASYPSSTPLSSTPLSSIPLSSIPLSSIPLSSIPLSSIALPTSPLSAVPLSSIDIDGYSGFCAFIAAETGGIVTCNDSVGGDTLGDVAADLEAASLAANPLSSIPLSSIPLSSIPLSSIDLFAVEIGGAPLSSIPLSSIPLSSIDLLVDCSLVNCETATLGDADAAGAILASATYGDLVDALSLEFLYGTGTLGDPDDLGNLALGQLLMAFLLRSDFPWETLPLEQIGAQEFSADHFVGYELSFDVGGNGPAVPAEATTIIPEGFLYVTGSGRLFADATESVVPVADPTATVEEDGTTTLAWMFAVAPGSGYSLSFDVVPSLSLGTYPASADLTIDTLPTESADATFATVTVIEADRGGEGYPTAGNDILYLGHITDATDVDYWEVQAPPPGYRVAVFLSSLSEDTDLVMYRPVSAIPASPVTPRSAPLSSIPLEDDGVNYGGNATEEPETLADIDLLSSPLASISTNRDTAGESVSTVATDLDRPSPSRYPATAVPAVLIRMCCGSRRFPRFRRRFAPPGSSRTP